MPGPFKLWAPNGRVLNIGGDAVGETVDPTLAPKYAVGEGPEWITTDTTPGQTLRGRINRLYPPNGLTRVYVRVTATKAGTEITFDVPVDETGEFAFLVGSDWTEASAIDAEVIGEINYEQGLSTGGAALPALAVVAAPPVAATFPGQIADWNTSAIEYNSLGWRIQNVVAKTVYDAAIGALTASDFELRVYYGEPAPNTAFTAGFTFVAANNTYVNTSVGRQPANTLLFRQLFWRRIADGEIVPASGVLTFQTPVPDVTEPPIVDNPPPPPTFPAIDVQVNSVSQLRSTIANMTKNTTIGLSPGNYGVLDLRELRHPDGYWATVVSADYTALGAIARNVNVENSSRIRLLMLRFDLLTGPSTGGSIVTARGAHDIDIDYCLISGGPENSRTNIKEPYRAFDGVLVDSTAFRAPARVRVRHCAIGSHLGKGVRFVRGNNHETEDNTFYMIGGDDMFTGNVPGLKHVNNFGSRDKMLHQDSQGRNDHCDFSQIYAGFGNHIKGPVLYRGNVVCTRGQVMGTGNAMQGFGGFDNSYENFTVEENFVTGINTPHGITLTGNKPGIDQSKHRNNLIRNNATMHVIDRMAYASRFVMISMRGLAPGSGRNVHHYASDNNQPAGGGMVMITSSSDGSPIRRYYGGPGDTVSMKASLYEHRPVEGAVTHWLREDGPPMGPAVRWREILNLDMSPKVNPVPLIRAKFEAQYDPRNQL